MSSAAEDIATLRKLVDQMGTDVRFLMAEESSRTVAFMLFNDRYTLRFQGDDVILLQTTGTEAGYEAVVAKIDELFRDTFGVAGIQ